VTFTAGENTLDLDLGRAHITGTVKLAGGALPATQPGSDGDVTFYARAKDTGARHSLGYLRYRYTGPGVYALYATDGQLDTRVLPGTYDILYYRNYSTSNDYTYTDDPADHYVNGYRVLATDVTFTAGENTLNLDLGRAHITGTVKLAGGALPPTQPGSDGDVTFYARAKDTGARHSLGYLRYRYAAPGVYALYDTDGQLDTRLLPGTYDILYYRNYSTSNDYTYTDDPADPYVNGYRVLATDVAFTAGENTLNLDLGRAHITGTVKLAGGALPATQPGSDGDVTFYARAKDTGARHSLGYLRYRYAAPGVYALYDTDGQLDTRLLPGTYDILYYRNYSSSNDYTYTDDPDDPYVNGYRVLEADVTFTAGENTLNLDLERVWATGSVTLDGGALPPTQPGSDGDVTFYLRARDTGARHSLGYLRYRYTAPGVYALYASDGELDARFLPGAYDLLYYRNYSSSNDYTYTDDPDDPYVNGYRVLARCVSP